MKLNLACGTRSVDGFVGVDIVKLPSVDIITDLLHFPWPFETESVEEICCLHFFEHVPGKLRFRFMDEIDRILIPGAKMLFETPYWSGFGAIQDPTHEWPPICAQSYAYFNKKWRDEIGLGHYDIQCDFCMDSIIYCVANDLSYEPKEQLERQVKRELNTVRFMQVILFKKSSTTIDPQILYGKSEP